MNEPKPLIEHHYHIQDLIDGQQKRTDDRNYHRERVKQLEERDKDIKDSTSFTVTDFWCDTCKQDFKSAAWREIEVDWSNTEQRIAFYRAKCNKKHWCMRLITDRKRDGFFIKSKLVALDRGNHTADIIQPYQTNYNLLYGKK